jgi:hypothetical protein
VFHLGRFEGIKLKLEIKIKTKIKNKNKKDKLSKRKMGS